MSKKNRKVRLNKQSVTKPQNKITSVSSSSVINKNIGTTGSVITTSGSKGMSISRHQHIVPDLIRIGIIAGIIFAIEIVLSFIIH